MIFCFGRFVSCVERLDVNGLKFSVKLGIPYIEFTCRCVYFKTSQKIDSDKIFIVDFQFLN